MGSLKFRAVLVFLLIAASAHAQRRHAVGWPFPLPACGAGVVIQAAFVDDFTLAGADLYFAYNSEIWRVPKVGGASPVMLTHALGDVLWMKVEDSRLYFATISGELTADIFSMPVGGGALTTIAAGQLTPVTFRTDAQFIYFVSVGTPSGDDFFLADGSVKRVAKSGGAVQTLASGLSFPLDVVVRGNLAYYGETGIAAGNTSAGLRRVAADGSGGVTKLFNGGPVTSIAIDDTNAYFVLPKLGTGLVDIDRIPLGGGAATPIVADLDFADGLVIQRGSLYYVAEANETASIDAVSLSGGAPRTVKAVETRLSRLEFDDCLMYYATDQRIERAAP